MSTFLHGFSSLGKRLSLVIFGLCCLVGAQGTGKKFPYNYSKTKRISAVLYTHEGNITIDLNFKESPNTVANFVDLARKGFYNGIMFHRVIQGFMIQGGDPNGDGTGGPGYTIDDEANTLKHSIGAVSMANRGPNTGGSQFFIVQMPQDHLNGRHTVFGNVTGGLDVIYRIEQGDPVTKIEIKEEKE